MVVKISGISDLQIYLCCSMWFISRESGTKWSDSPHRADGAEVVKFLEKMYSIGYWGIYDILFYLGLVLSNK